MATIELMGQQIELSENETAALNMLQGRPDQMGGHVGRLADVAPIWAAEQCLPIGDFHPDPDANNVLRWLATAGWLTRLEVPVGATAMAWHRPESRYCSPNRVQCCIVQHTRPGVFEGRAYYFYVAIYRQPETEPVLMVRLGGRSNSVTFKDLLAAPTRWQIEDIAAAWKFYNKTKTDLIQERSQAVFEFELGALAQGPVPWTTEHPLCPAFLIAMQGLIAMEECAGYGSTHKEAKRYQAAESLFKRVTQSNMRLPTALVELQFPPPLKYKTLCREINGKHYIPYPFLLSHEAKKDRIALEELLYINNKRRPSVLLDFKAVNDVQVWTANVTENTRHWDLVQQDPKLRTKFVRDCESTLNHEFNDFRDSSAQALVKQHGGYEFHGHKYGDKFYTK